MAVGLIQVVASVRPTKQSLRVVATLRAAAIPADLLAGAKAQPTPSFLWFGTLVNAVTSIFAYSAANRME